MRGHTTLRAVCSYARRTELNAGDLPAELKNSLSAFPSLFILNLLSSFSFPILPKTSKILVAYSVSFVATLASVEKIVDVR